MKNQTNNVQNTQEGKFTPGEWKAEGFREIVIHSEGKQIAFMSVQNPESVANSELICKAVNNHDNLVAALQDAKEQIEYLTKEALKYRKAKHFVYGTTTVCIATIDSVLTKVNS